MFKESLSQKPENTSILDNPEGQALLAEKLGGVYSARPEIGDFVHAINDNRHWEEYTQDAIDDDIRYVEETRRNINDNMKALGENILSRNEDGFALGEMMQAMVIDQMNKHWMLQFKAVMTSDYDDLKNGIDSVFKHKTHKYLGASFDFTISSNAAVVRKKLEREWNSHVETGQLSTVKYFEDPDTGEKSRLVIPKFIIGGSKKDLEEMADAYLHNKQDVLKNHRFQYLIIEQIYEQVVMALDYYDQEENPRHNFAKKQYEEIYEIISALRKENSEHINNLDFFEYSKENVALQTMRAFAAEKKNNVAHV